MDARWLAWLACLGTAGAAPYEIRKDWDLWFGRTDSAAVYTAAVCPDGTFFLSNGRGTAVVVRRDGRSVSNWGRPEFRNSHLAGCDARGWLYVMSHDGGLTILEGDRVVAEWFPPVRIDRLVAANEATIYAAGYARNRLPLHAIGPDGKVLYSFGERQSPFLINGGPRVGFPLWDARRNRLLYVPGQEYEIRAYQADGHLLEVRTPGPREWIRPVDFGRPRYGPQPVGTALLPDGRVLVQTRAMGTPPMALDLFDAKLDQQQTGLYYPGTLQAASADGGMYFLITNPELRVARVRLRR